MQKCRSRTTGKRTFCSKGNSIYASTLQSLQTLTFGYKPQNLLEVEYCNPVHFAEHRQRGHHGFDCPSYRGRSCRMQGSHPHCGARGVDGPPPPWVFVMLQYFEKIPPLIESL